MASIQLKICYNFYSKSLTVIPPNNFCLYIGNIHNLLPETLLPISFNEHFDLFIISLVIFHFFASLCCHNNGFYQYRWFSEDSEDLSNLVSVVKLHHPKVVGKIHLCVEPLFEYVGWSQNPLCLEQTAFSEGNVVVWWGISLIRKINHFFCSQWQNNFFTWEPNSGR